MAMYFSASVCTTCSLHFMRSTETKGVNVPTRTSMDVGMVHCVPESMCTYIAIYREAMETVEDLRNKEG